MNALLEYFDETFLINLPERTDRLKSAQQQLARIGAHLGQKGVALFPALRFPERAGFPNAAIRGCFNSHRECFRLAVGRAHRLLMLEDDIVFTPALQRLSHVIVAQLDTKPWDIIYFGHEASGNIGRARLDTNPSEFRFEPAPPEVQTTHFFGINGKILPRLVAHLDRLANGVEGDNLLGPMPIDGALNTFRQLNSDVQCLIAVPKLGWQRPSRSDILPKAFDRLQIIRPFISAARQMKYMASYLYNLRR